MEENIEELNYIENLRVYTTKNPIDCVVQSIMEEVLSNVGI